MCLGVNWIHEPANIQINISSIFSLHVSLSQENDEKMEVEKEREVTAIMGK